MIRVFSRTVFSASLVLLIGPLHGSGAAPLDGEPLPEWWSASWPYRARIRIPTIHPGHLYGRKPPNTAWIPDLRLCGRSPQSGHDLRVVNEIGEPINFRVLQHRPDRYGVLQIQVPRREEVTAWLYFGNREAFPIDTMGADEFAPRWEAKAMVEMRTYRKKTKKHPKTLAELQAMIKEAGEPEGITFAKGVYSGHNPFGESDHYISVFDGHIRVEEPGEHLFHAYADDGCWVLLDGKEVLSWPGPRIFNMDRWNLPGHDFKANLQPGLHRIQFFHEEGEENQIAFLRWKPPSWTHINNIAKAQWGYLRWAHIDFVQAADRPLVAGMKPRIRHTYWIPDTEHQLNWVAVDDRSMSTAGKIVKRRFEMDDGTVYETNETGRAVEHIFFSNGAREITLTVTDEEGNTDTASCKLDLWQINTGIRYELGAHRDPIAALLGQRGGYLPMSDQYLDRFETVPEYRLDSMTDSDLVGYALFWDTFADDRKLLAAVAELARRDPDHAWLGRLAGRAVRSALRSGAEMDIADSLLEREEKRESSPEARAATSMRRVYLLTWGKGDHERALEMIHSIRAKAGSTTAWRSLVHRAWIAEGDVYVLQGDYEKAKTTYRRAERTDSRTLSRPAKLARVGSYPFAVEDYLSRDMYEEAIDVINQWEDMLPLVKLEGLTLFLRGRCLYLIRPSAVALRYLRAAEAVNPGALHVPHAVWLGANCLLALERYEAAAVQFMRLRKGFTTAKYRERAVEKLEECRKHLEGPSPTTVP